MSKNVNISIIVPAYNAEKVVEKCVRSICRQTVCEMEILAVDDGSLDNTGEILRKLAGNDVRIKVIQKEPNEGLSAARNTALSFASGEYIGFVDADDWVEEDYFVQMYQRGRGADLIVAGYTHDSMSESLDRTYVARRVRMQSGDYREKKKIVAAAADVDTAKMFAYTWNKLYKKSLIDQLQRRFTDQVYIEDFLFNALFWDDIQSLVIVDHCGYHYVKASKEALTQRFQPNYAEIMDLRYEAIKKLMVKNLLFTGKRRAALANIYIKHAVAGIARNCSPDGHYSLKKRFKKATCQIRSKNAREARKYAAGTSVQEKICNGVFRTGNPILLLMLGRMIYWMQTRSHTAFDRLK